MAGNKGFTLMEILIVLVILGILIAIAIPNYYNSIYISKARGVENNLRAIGAAQQKYYEDHGSYYSSSNFGAINSNLSLSMTDDGFNYTCAVSGTCSASSATYPITISVDSTGAITCSTGPCP